MRSTLSQSLGRHLITGSLAMFMFLTLGCGSDNPSGPGTDNTAPTINTTTPLPGATGVMLITASFSESMMISSIEQSSFTLTGPNSEVIHGTVSYDFASQRAHFLPNEMLTPNTRYTAMITTGAQDLAGNAMAVDYSWSFNTSDSGTTRHAPEFTEQPE